MARMTAVDAEREARQEDQQILASWQRLSQRRPYPHEVTEDQLKRYRKR